MITKDIIYLSNLFIKQAQHTEFDKNINNELTRQKNLEYNWFKKKNFPQLQSNFGDLYYCNDPKYTEWYNTIPESSFYQDPKNISDKLSLPDIEDYHLKLPEKYKNEFLQKYNALKIKLSQFKEIYDYGNELLSKKPINYIENLSLIELIKNLPEILYFKLIEHQHKKIGNTYDEILYKFLNSKINLFKSDVAEYYNSTYFSDAINDLNNINEVLDRYLNKYDIVPQRAEKLRKKLQEFVDNFLSDKSNLQKLHNLNKFKTPLDVLNDIIKFPEWELNIIYLPSYLTKLFKSYSDRFTNRYIGQISTHVKDNLHRDFIKILNDKIDFYKDIVFNIREDATVLINSNPPPSPSDFEIFFNNKIKPILLKNNVNIESYFIFNNLDEKERQNIIESFLMKLTRLNSRFTNHENLMYETITKIKNNYLNLKFEQIVNKDLLNEFDQILKKELVNKILLKFPDDPIEKDLHANIFKALPNNNTLIAVLQFGDFSFKNIAAAIENNLKCNLSPKEMANLVKMAIKDIGLMNNLIIPGDEKFILYKVLEKINKKDVNNIVKYFYKNNDDNYTSDINDLYRDIDRYNNNGSKKIISDKELINIFIKIIRAPETIKTDLSNLREVIKIAHDSASEITPDQIITICQNKNFNLILKLDAVKKLYSLYISIMVNGGINNIQKKYKNSISALKSKKIISHYFIDNLKKIILLFESNQKFNPEIKNFDKLMALCNQVDSDFTILKSAEAYQELYEKAENKIPEIFLLDYSINPRLRFRVLKDKDPRHLKIGVETNCCQRVGDNAAGETAARDSFINKEAGVLILEWLNDNKIWVILSQSYFHYVPRHNSYILDNVESNSKNINLSGIKLEEVYAYYASQISNKLNVQYFLAGKGYSKLEIDKFNSKSLRNDPRTFNPNSLTKERRTHYTDFKPKSSIDLTRPKFKIKSNPNTWGETKQESNDRE